MLVSLPATALAQRPRIDPGALDHGYADLDLQPGLDRHALERLENTPEHNEVTDHGARLGRVLFYDPRLSRNRRVSCASCHKQENAFADPQALSRGFERKPTGRNSMSLANVAYYSNGRFFWDERGGNLEEMVLMPIQDPVEMGMNLEHLVERLEDDAGYRWLFWQAFGDPEVTVERVAFSLAQFLRSLISFGSRFDDGLARAKAIEADFPNFSAEENLGKRIFLGLADGNRAASCASCHMIDVGPGGALTEERLARLRAFEVEVRPAIFQGGQPTCNGVDAGEAGDDAGRGAVTGAQGDVGKFKVPSLRNIALTGPYMHDGRFESLEQVVEHYSTGIRPHVNVDQRLSAARGGGGWGPPRRVRARPIAVTIPTQFLPQGIATHFERTHRRVLGVGVVEGSESGPGLDGFDFSDVEKGALLAFLKTLTDREFVRDPRFSDPFR